MKPYHYTECGLDNIYLANGVKITKTKDGEEIFIHDIHGLHAAIGMALIFKQGSLTGNEIKFIRTTLDLSQKSLGHLLGLDYQTILAWEKNKSSITKTAENLLRITFYSYLKKKPDSLVYEKINEIADLESEDTESKPIEFKEVGHEWRLASAA